MRKPPKAGGLIFINEVIIMRKPLLSGKWASRKLWALIFSALFVVLNDVYGLGISEDAYWAIVGLASSYLIGQGIADARKPE